MYDRSDYDLRFMQHRECMAALNQHGWKYMTSRRRPAPRQTVAALLRALAARLDPAHPEIRSDTPAANSLAH